MKTELLIKSIYENFKITEPILIELINSPIMQRLKHINMGGVNSFTSKKWPDYSRYNHSIGVFVLVKKYGATLEEQIAGLLHDASHTAFSHVGDFLFKQKDYQDNIHEWFLKEANVDKILGKYNISLENILHKSGHHKILEQDLPDICADRLEYNLANAIQFNVLNSTDIKEIIDNLKFEKETWFFTNPQIAKKFASISLYMVKNFWAANWNILIYDWTSDCLKLALQKNIINPEEINFSTDNVLWQKLENSDDKEILNLLDKIKNYEKYFKACDVKEADQVLYGKFRGIDPLVRQDNKLERLTNLDKDFYANYNKLKTELKTGLSIKFLK